MGVLGGLILKPTDADFTNTHSMVIDQDREGFTVSDNNLYFSDGSGNDLPFSILGWFKTPSFFTAGRKVIFFHDGIGTLHITLEMTTGDKFQLKIRTSAGNQLRATSTTALSTDTWVYIAATKTSGETISDIKLYFDNANDTVIDTSSGTYTGLPANIAPESMKMPDPTAASQTFVKCNLIRVFDKVLSLAEIQANTGPGIVAVAVPGGQLGNLVCEYVFNENTDAGAAGINGSEIGAPTYDTDIPA